MGHMKALFVLSGVFSAIQCTNLPRQTPPPEKRDTAPVSTLNIGAITNFQQTTTGVQAPSGTDVAIYPTDASSIPSDGIYLLLGPELQTSLQSAVDANCANVGDSKCLDSIKSVFNTDGDANTIQERGVSWFGKPTAKGVIGILFENIVAYLTAKWKDNASPGGPQPPPLNFHFPASALSQLSSASAASVVAFKTATDDPTPVEVSMSATDPASTSGSSNNSPLTTATADGDGFSTGDFEINLDTGNDDAMNALNSFITGKSCQAAPTNAPARKRGLHPANELNKRDPNVIECLLADAQNIVDAMGAGGALSALAQPAMQVAQTFPLPEFANADYAAAFGEFVVWGGDAVPQALTGISQPEIVPVMIFSFLLAVANYGQIFMKGRRLFLQSKSLITDKEYAAICPSDGSKYQPSCSKWYCLGNNGKCTSDLLKPCPCAGDSSSATSSAASATTSGPCPTNGSKAYFCADTTKCSGKGGFCQSGDQKDCQCIDVVENNGQGPDPSDWLDTQQQILDQIGECTPGQCDATGSATSSAGSSQPTTQPSCDTGACKISEIPFNVFSPGVWTGFCNATNKDPKTALSQIVDSNGNVIPNKAKDKAVQRDNELHGRTPPPNPNAYSGYTFSLDWSGGGDCPSDCGSAWSKIANSPCGHQGGQSNVMALSGKLDTGCGIYSYSIAPPPGSPTCTPPASSSTPPPAPTVGPIQCATNRPEYSKCWNDVHANSVEGCASAMAAQLPNGNMTPNHANLTQVYREGAGGSGGGGNGVTYMMNIGWIPGCTTYSSMVPDNPLGKSGDNTISYTTIIKNTYYQCTGNDGLGGYADVGCLRYGFYPNNINGVFASPPHPEYFWNQYPNICG